VKAKGLVWMGIPTEDFEGAVAFFHDVLGMVVELRETDFAVLRLPGGETVEVFGPSLRRQEQFATGPVVGFLVENAALARQEMEERGVEFVGPVHHGDPGRARAHFRGPGGKVFEITQVPEESPLG
jgi:predicted enzyme related to lactoylglutathione lyase